MATEWGYVCQRLADAQASELRCAQEREAYTANAQSEFEQAKRYIEEQRTAIKEICLCHVS